MTGVLQQQVGELAGRQRTLLLAPDSDEFAYAPKDFLSLEERCSRRRARKAARTVDETQNTGRLLLLVGPSATLADHRLGPHFERLARLKRSVVTAAGNLVRIRVASPVNFLELTLATEDDEVVATGRQAAERTGMSVWHREWKRNRIDSRDNQNSGNKLEAIRIVDVGEVFANVLGGHEGPEVPHAQIFKESKELLRVGDGSENLHGDEGIVSPSCQRGCRRAKGKASPSLRLRC